MEEQFYTISKHATTFRIKSAVDAAGKITGAQLRRLLERRRLCRYRATRHPKIRLHRAGPLRHRERRDRVYSLYTNRPPAGALRGFGIPQLVWAYESHTDLIARELNIDPVEFRRKNILRESRPQATGTDDERRRDRSASWKRVAERMNWSAPFDRGSGAVRRGRGVGIGFKASISPTTSVAFVNIYADGSCALYMSTVDMGQGSDTAMAQIVAEVLRVQAENVRVIHPDTDVTPYDMATLGSRSTFHMGNAVKLAAEDAKQKLEALATERRRSGGIKSRRPARFSRRSTECRRAT